ncbi:MAG: hypothetical protein PF518_03210 [Spirochaetaceae bacterium]|jgi:23S rRNA-/tRNA-specific pseudouridylate synthase|nr:hypothetical protein [Spirochaetaceae bacterium]
MIKLVFEIAAYSKEIALIMGNTFLDGRFHQRRRHMARIGHPVLGDTSHGDLRHNRIFENYYGNDRLLLHAEKIRYPHPVTSEKHFIN